MVPFPISTPNKTPITWAITAPGPRTGDRNGIAQKIEIIRRPGRLPASGLMALPLTAIEDFRKLGEKNELFRKLADACDRHQGCWNGEAEKILLDEYRVSCTE